MKKPLIILGGMGPQASVRLHEHINHGDGSFRAPDEFPLIIHASIPVPDFIASEDATEGAVEMINDVTSHLPMKDAGAIGLACNTAHLLLDRLNIPKDNFVSMIDSVVDDIVKAESKKVGLLASPFTIKSKLYENALAKKGIEVIRPNEDQIDVLNSIIHDVIGNIEPMSLRQRLTTIAIDLQKKGADVTLLGCTELPLVGIDVDGPVIDSLSSLARHLQKRV